MRWLNSLASSRHPGDRSRDRTRWPQGMATDPPDLNSSSIHKIGLPHVGLAADDDDSNTTLPAATRSESETPLDTNADLSPKEAVIWLLADNDGELPQIEFSGMASGEYAIEPTWSHDTLNALRRDGRVMQDYCHTNRWIVLIHQ